MTGPVIALDMQVTTALLSAGVALVVALLGIAGAVWAQLVATRRAYSNSLALFERQHAVEEASRRQERTEALRREDAQRFADERRMIYAKFLRAADDLVAAHRSAETYIEIAAQSREKENEEPADWRRRAAAEAERRADDSVGRAQTAADQLAKLGAEIDLLASKQVRAAAKRLSEATDWSAFATMRMRMYSDARAAFLEAARSELGVVAGD